MPGSGRTEDRCVLKHAGLDVRTAAGSLRGSGTGRRCLRQAQGAGGQAWGLRYVDAIHLGNSAGTSTAVSVGIDLANAQKLEELGSKISEANKQMAQVLQRLGMDRVDVNQIKRLLSAATGPRQKMLARAAHQLGLLVQAQQKLLKERDEFTSKAVPNLEGAMVVAREGAFPNIRIAVGTARKHLRYETATARFYLKDGQIVDY